MKKMFLAVLGAALFVFSGCNNLEVSSEKSAGSGRKTVLENLKKTGSYKLSEEEVFQSLDAFLSNNEGARVASSNSYSLIESKKVDADFAVDSRNAEADSVEFNVYSISGTGYALTSNDRRIGALLAVVPEGKYGDSENEFTEFFNELLDGYVNETVYLWNDISSGDGRSVENETIMTEGKYTFDSVKFNDSNTSCILKTKWGQSGIYNDAIEAVYGINYLAGCTTIGTAQVIAYNEPPVKLEQRYYDKVMANWPKAKALEWDGSLDWEEIKNPNRSELGKVELAAFIYEVAEKINVSYGVSATSGFTQNCNDLLKDFYLRTDGVKNYDFDLVVDSIDNGSPMFMSGSNKKSGHLFNIDAYASLTVNATHKTTGEKIQFTDNFVHCNLGWNGSDNGYYLSGVFDTRSDSHYIRDNLAREIEYNADWTFSSRVQIVPNVCVDENLIPHPVAKTLVSYIDCGFGNAVYFAGDFEESEAFGKAIRGTYQDGKWVLDVTFPDEKYMNYNVYVGSYDLGKSVQGGFEGLVWTEGDNKVLSTPFNRKSLYSPEKPDYGYAVYFTGTFDGANNWRRAVRGEFTNGAWFYVFDTDNIEKFEYKALIGPYDLGEAVEYSYPGLSRR